MGFFNGGRFNLTVSLRYQPQVGELDFFCEVFNEASRILHDATDGTHSIGTVLYATNSFGGADASVFVHPDSDVWPNSTSARLWFPTEAMDMSQDFMMWPTIMAHELAHYLYDLRDEYNNGSVCQGSIGTQASMMEGYNWTNYTRWTDGGGADYDTFGDFIGDYTGAIATLQQGEPTEYCHAGNHNSTANNNQNNINGAQSCWTYMAADANHNGIVYGLTAPGAGGPATAAPGALAAITCTTLIPVQRFELVLDRSGSMAGAKFDQLKIGANFWVDYVNPLEELGLVTYSSNVTEDVLRSEVPAAAAAQVAWRDDRHTAIDHLVAGGATAIGDALRRGLTAIVAGGRAASQVIVLFTDGLQNVGVETAEAVLPDLVANGVRVYTIGLGGDQDAALLQSISTVTGASYFPISGDLSAAAAEAAITAALVQIAGESRENGGVIFFDSIDGVGAVIDPTAPFFGGDEQGANGEEGGRSLRFGVPISEGSSHASLGAMWRTGKKGLRVRIYDPDGNAVPAGPLVRAVRGRYPYSFYEVDQPQPGTWQVEVLGSGLGSAGLRSLGFEVNDAIRLEASIVPRHPVRGKSFRIRARLLSPHPVPGASVTAHVYSPVGAWSQFVLSEGAIGTADEGLYVADVLTEEGTPGQYLVILDAFRAAGTFDQEIDHLYTLRSGFVPGEEKRIVVTPEIRRRATLSAVTTKEEPDPDEPKAGENKIDPIIPEDHDKWLARWHRAHPAKTPPKPKWSLRDLRKRPRGGSDSTLEG
ncbi:VWA domain-containing protein [Microbacterium lacus]|uniref:vWA domain-containing protein n=1 Tax=Microbacterium lacus TaxID=415217 RepID=UPI00384DD5DB